MSDDIHTSSKAAAAVLNKAAGLALELRGVIRTSRQRIDEAASNLDRGGRPATSLSGGILGRSANDLEALSHAIGVLADLTGPLGITGEEWARAMTAPRAFFHGPKEG